MFNIQNLPQFSAFNKVAGKTQNKFSTPAISNNLERSPMRDTVNFTGKNDDDYILEPEDFEDARFVNFDDIPEAEIVSLDDDAVEVIPDDEIILLDEADDAEDADVEAYNLALLQDEQEAFEKRLEEEEENRKRQFEDDMFMNDMLVYGVVLPEMVSASVQADDVQNNDSPIIGADDYLGTDDYLGDDNSSSMDYDMDNGFDDFGF